MRILTDEMLLVLILLLVVLGYFNEKISKLTYEILLMLYTAVISVVVVLAGGVFRAAWAENMLAALRNLNLEKLLIDGILCFMLFAGSCHMQLQNFKKHGRIIALPAFGAAALGCIEWGRGETEKGNNIFDRGDLRMNRSARI